MCSSQSLRAAFAPIFPGCCFILVFHRLVRCFPLPSRQAAGECVRSTSPAGKGLDEECSHLSFPTFLVGYTDYNQFLTVCQPLCESFSFFFKTFLRRPAPPGEFLLFRNFGLNSLLPRCIIGLIL